MAASIAFDIVALILICASTMCGFSAVLFEWKKAVVALATVLFIVGEVFSFAKYPAQLPVVGGALLISLMGLALLIGLAVKAILPWLKQKYYGYRTLIISDGSPEAVVLAHLLVERGTYAKEIRFWCSHPTDDLPGQVEKSSSPMELRDWIRPSQWIYYFPGEGGEQEIAPLIKIEAKKAIVVLTGSDHHLAARSIARENLRVVASLIHTRRAIIKHLGEMHGVDPSAINLQLFGNPKKVMILRSTLTPLSLQRLLTEEKLQSICDKICDEHNTLAAYQYLVSLIDIMSQFVDGEADVAVSTFNSDLWGGRLKTNWSGTKVELEKLAEGLTAPEKAQINQFREELKTLV